ncbi:MAG: ABC transporter substrate-binding protein [Acidisphaera sp.]|nr:ABC transporter substrate-binding protein [Acidisphaera sp.]
MKRRDFLLTAASGAMSGLAAPNLARAADNRVLRFIPQANLANLDPIWGTQYVVRNASLLIWDTLYGVDASLTPKSQMCEGHEMAEDGKTWTFRLRDGLKFHDGTPVLSRDVVASLNRWMARDPNGQTIKHTLDSLDAVDDRTFRFRLSKPFTKMLFALGKANAPVAFIMPERLARTDPFAQISEYVGSGPMVFKKDEWVPGSNAVFEKFAGYQPRAEAGEWMAGGKRMMLDRIEWKIIPDAATASAALQNGEVDWWETPIPDVIPLLKRNGSISVDIADPLGNVGSFRMNHMYKPFSDVRARRAVQIVLSQSDYMQAVVGNDPALWKELPSFFTPGTPSYSAAGGEVLSGPRKIDAAKKLLAEAGYDGEKIVLLVATDVSITKGEGDITAELLKQLGMNVDYVATDWGTVGQRRAKKDPPEKGGWNIFHTWHAGADCINPAPYTALRTNGDQAWFGWPKDDHIEALIADWYNAPDDASGNRIIAEIDRASMDFVTYIPTGFFLAYQGWRRNVSGVVKAPFPVFWGVQKS